MPYISGIDAQRYDEWKNGASNEALGRKLFLEKEFMDLKIICKGKTFECHKTVLSCQSDVFKTMLLNKNMDEAKSGEVKIKDINGKFL